MSHAAKISTGPRTNASRNLVGPVNNLVKILVELIDYSRKFTLGPVVSLGKYFTYILTYVISIQC